MIEYLDLVDEKNNVIGQTTKEESHRLGYPHRVVAIFVTNQLGELLINLRADTKLWDHSVGGHVRQHEDNLSAANREGSEEIGLPGNQPLKFLGEFLLNESLNGKSVNHWFIVYSTMVNSDFILRCQEGEVLELKWIKIEDLLNEIGASKEKFDQGFINTLNFYIKKSQ
ncbi:MAG: NUDIX domain-containing protein [Candidatus Buchananbacteria bacterium]